MSEARSILNYSRYSQKIKLNDANIATRVCKHCSTSYMVLLEYATDVVYLQNWQRTKFKVCGKLCRNVFDLQLVYIVQGLCFASQFCIKWSLKRRQCVGISVKAVSIKFVKRQIFHKLLGFFTSMSALFHLVTLNRDIPIR